MTDILLSVIVPVFNTEIYLKKCLDSIIHQTYSEIEVILIDDGSTDGSSEICDIFAENNVRITVIHQENRGQGNARKKGLKQAKGKYIYYIDADDWVDEDLIENLVKRIKEYRPDIISVGVKREYGDDKIHIDSTPFADGFYDKKAIEQKIIPKLIYTDRFFEWGQQLTLWHYAIKKELLEVNQKKVSDQIRIAEDVACVFPCIVDAKNMYIYSESYYHYRQRSNSIKRSVFLDELENLRLVCQVLMDKFKYSDKKQALLKKVKYLVAFELLTSVSADIMFVNGTYPFKDFPSRSKLIVYGAGVFGTNVIRALKESNYADVVAWVDSNYKKYQSDGYRVKSPDILHEINYDYIIIAVIRADIRRDIFRFLSIYNIPDEKIIDIDLDKINQTNVLEKI